MAIQLARHYFSVDEYDRMAEAGILTEEDRVELIDGEIIDMSPIGSSHAGCVNRLTALLSRLLGQTAIVSIQNPVRLGDTSKPQPDIAVLRPRDDFYAGEHPGPADILLVIEVSDTTQDYDRQVKARLYARADIPEYWLVDLPAETIEVYTQPKRGRYQMIRLAGRGETIGAQGISGFNVAVDAILG